MAIQLTNEDHGALDRYVNDVLDALQRGAINQSRAREDLAHAIWSAAQDRPSFKRYIRTTVDYRWE